MTFFENLFLDFVNLVLELHFHMCNMCVQKFHNCNTSGVVLRCVTSFFEVLRSLQVLLFVVPWEQFRHHLIFVLRLKNLFRQQLYQ